MLWLALMTMGQEIRTLQTVCLGSSIFKGNMDQNCRNHVFSQYGKLLDLYFVQCMLQIFSQGLSHHLGLCDGRFINRFRLVQIFLFQQMESLAVSTLIGFLGEIASKNQEKTNTIVCWTQILRQHNSLEQIVIGNCFKVPWS